MFSHNKVNDGGPAQPLREYYSGTLLQATLGSMVEPSPSVHGSAEARLDVDRSDRMGLRAKAVWAASSVRDATAIAVIRASSRTALVPHEALGVCRVDLQPFHIGPVAIIDELRLRLETGTDRLEQLVRQYWTPAATWHIREIIARSMTVLEGVPAESERDVYIRRWVHYNEDRARAAALSREGGGPPRTCFLRGDVLVLASEQLRASRARSAE